MNGVSQKQGFTLVEMLAAVTIIGILVAIAVFGLGRTRDQGFRAALISDLRSLALSQEVHRAGTGTYASSLGDLDFRASAGNAVTLVGGDRTGWSAWGTHQRVEPMRCAIFSGDAAPVDPATVESLIECDF